MIGPKRDLTGQRFGKWVVLRMERPIVSSWCKGYMAVCKCECGTERGIQPSILINGISKSCGCSKERYVKTRGKNSVQFTGYEEISGAFLNKVEQKAKLRKIEYNVTPKYIWNLFIMQNRKCALSGIELVFGVLSPSSKSSVNTVMSASLDRIDSSRGYIEGNVQWVHKNVNIMKNAFSQDFFIDMCKKIHDNMEEKG